MKEKETAPAGTEALNIKFTDNYTSAKRETPAQNEIATCAFFFQTPRQFVAANPAFTMGGLRSYIFYEDLNGLKASGAIKRIGRKILIDPERFNSWVATNPQPTGDAL